MIVFPNAKINIGLNVISRRSDGFHNLETVFYPVKIYDILEVEEDYSSDKISFSSTGLIIDGAPENNLVVRAANMLADDFKLPGLKIHLHKQIPFGAGLGGGSADAALGLDVINRLVGLNLTEKELESYAARLGSDCAFFVRNKPCFANGRGEQLESIDLNLDGHYIAVVKPSFGVSTAEAYRNIKPQQPENSLRDLIKLNPVEWSGKIGNDFEASVFPLYPAIEQIRETLYDSGAFYASMSGSGSSVFGFYKERPEIKPSDFAVPTEVFVVRA
ncbi:MAG: 4-(cytidine 5'-diphospho)-2-C-methyl-D-erythritol kinase [Bacteroidota bacterium]|nr:4-(cytidine 5'-diphospho)-2-C-methyl-D-erythritol kinase [Bacteroidota bacterium]